MKDLKILTNPTKRDLDAVLQMSARLACRGCGLKPAGMAVPFIPNEPWRYIPNAPREGAQRSLIYPLCEPCIKAGKCDEVEDALAAVNGFSPEPPTSPPL